MKSAARTTLVLLAMLSICACSRNGADPAAKEPPPGSMGTSTGGGGGNGIDGKPIESYAIRIEKLPEYRLYVLPIIRKISRGNGDVLSAYLIWAAAQKPWYSVPRELEFVSKQRTGLWMSTEQLAIQSESEVFLHTPTYQRMKPEERANLLIHEMVMAARFLMKRPPQEQCEILSKGGSKACSDPEVLKLAKLIPYDPEAAKIMDEADHAAVRGLTRYLTNAIDDVTPEGVAQLRRSLKFVFPWDPAISFVELQDIDAALRRESARSSIFKVLPTIRKTQSGKVQEDECLFNPSYYGGGYLYLTNVDAAPLGLADPASLGYETEVEWGGGKTKRYVYYGDYNGYAENFRDELISARGAVNPNDEKEIVDYVTTIFEPTKETADQSLVPLTEFWLSRESPPRLIEFKKSFARIVFRDRNARDEWDLVPAPDQPVKRCVLKR